MNDFPEYTVKSLWNIRISASSTVREDAIWTRKTRKKKRKEERKKKSESVKVNSRQKDRKIRNL